MKTPGGKTTHTGPGHQEEHDVLTPGHDCGRSRMPLCTSHADRSHRVVQTNDIRIISANGQSDPADSARTARPPTPPRQARSLPPPSAKEHEPAPRTPKPQLRTSTEVQGSHDPEETASNSPIPKLSRSLRKVTPRCTATNNSNQAGRTNLRKSLSTRIKQLARPSGPLMWNHSEETTRNLYLREVTP